MRSPTCGKVADADLRNFNFTGAGHHRGVIANMALCKEMGIYPKRVDQPQSGHFYRFVALPHYLNMRKRIIVSSPTSIALEDRVWLDLEKIALVEVTSESPDNPADFALVAGKDSGWTASQSGEQTLRLIFDLPQKLRHVRLVFNENNYQRTQEFVLRWSADGEVFS